MENLVKLFSLFKERKLEVKTGVFIELGEEINNKIYLENDLLIIKFESPFPYVHVTELGPIKLKNIVRPKVDSISINESGIMKIILNNFMDFEFDLKDLD